MKIPPHWQKGALIDLQRFGDGSFRAILLGEEAKPELGNFIDFESANDAQAWISEWYSQSFTGFHP